MKRTVKVKANDGYNRIEISAKINTGAGLTRDEANKMATQVGRQIADVLRGVSYTDFGIENTRVQA
jgi:hypothetical protein